MLEQRLNNRRPGPLEGVGVIALAALALVAGSAFFFRLAPRLGALASVLFLAYGCAIAWWMLNWYALGFVYTVNDDLLRVCRVYGKRERFMADVWLNRVVGWGTPEAMKARFPGARVQRATRPQCPLEPLALAYRDGDRTAVIVLQPDEAVRARLMERIGGK